MAKFGLACEGITDQIVIENILCGFYKDLEDDEIQAFQPSRDETNRKQEENSGGWTRLLTYLSESRFKEDVLNSEYTIVQVDSDICDEVNFDVKKDTSCMITFIESIKARLISSIDSKEIFYEDNKYKIIFAISVHSLECWLLPICKDLKAEKITSCFEALQRECKDIKVEKNYSTYDKLSKIFSKNKNLLRISSKNSSFDIFIKSLPEKI